MSQTVHDVVVSQVHVGAYGDIFGSLKLNNDHRFWFC